MSNFFQSAPNPPENVSAAAVIARQIDGLGMRFHHALHGLSETDCSCRLSEDSMSIGELLRHLFDLCNWVHQSVLNNSIDKPDGDLSLGQTTLANLWKLRQYFAAMRDEELKEIKLGERPFWSLINMPISDMAHHIGQIAIMRRAAGNPIGGGV